MRIRIAPIATAIITMIRPLRDVSEMTDTVEPFSVIFGANLPGSVLVFGDASAMRVASPISCAPGVMTLDGAARPEEESSEDMIGASGVVSLDVGAFNEARAESICLAAAFMRALR